MSGRTLDIVQTLLATRMVDIGFHQIDKTRDRGCGSFDATSGWCDRSDVVVESRTGKCASGRGVLSETQVTEPRVESDSSHTRIINKVRNDIVAVSHLIVFIAYLPHSTMWEIV